MADSMGGPKFSMLIINYDMNAGRNFTYADVILSR